MPKGGAQASWGPHERGRELSPACGWRIVEAGLWDRAYLDLCAPATLTITSRGAETAFAAMEASLDIAYARDPIGYRCNDVNEGDHVEGEGTAELLEGGAIEIELPTTKAKRPFSKPSAIPSTTILSCIARRVENQPRLNCRAHV